MIIQEYPCHWYAHIIKDELLIFTPTMGVEVIVTS